MALTRFLVTLFTFIGVLASASAVVLTVTLMLRFPLILIAVVISLLLLEWILKRLPGVE